MERNADDTFGATGNVGSTNTGSTNLGSTGGTGSMGAGSMGAGSMGSGSMGAGMAGNTQPAGGLDYGTNSSSTGGADPDSKVDQLKSTAQDKFGQLRDKTRNLQSSLADRLEQGADKLRQRNQSATLAGATGDGGSTAMSTDERAKVQDSVARGMEKSADWLRNGDLKADIERQVRDNPGRTLLVALGVGYLLGKAFRGPNR